MTTNPTRRGLTLYGIGLSLLLVTVLLVALPPLGVVALAGWVFWLVRHAMRDRKVVQAQRLYREQHRATWGF